LREMRAKYPDEKEFRAALQQWRKDHPIPKGTIHDVVDHIEHIIKVAGIDHVGLGSDFDGIDAAPEQLDDVSKYPLITQELLNRGYKKEQILKVLGGNFMRVFRAVEQAAGKK
jgi:membrane dipeptidase